MIIRTLISGVFVLVAATTVASSQKASEIGSYREWKAYAFSSAQEKSCYIASQPQDKKYSQNISGRDPVFLLVTTRVATDATKSIQNEVSAIIGYPFKPDSKVTVDVDGKKFTMFTREDNAWFDDRSVEATFIDAMKAGNSMTVQGTSGRGTVSTDTYSLAGVTAGLKAIASACP